MATIQSSLRMYDGITGPLRAISGALNTVIGSFETMQSVSANPVETAKLKDARNELKKVDTAVIQIEEDIRASDAAQNQLNHSLKNGQLSAEGLAAKVKKLVGVYAGIQGIRLGVKFVADAISLQNVKSEAETKLQTIMQRRMGASPEEIQSVKDMAAAQQRLGVIGDETQLGGAQQLSTFLNSTQALNTLIPAMNNLAVQQNGVNATTEDMVNIGNLMGKAMQGQTGALTRVGITFDAAQEHVLKYGNEQERAAMLAEVITNNVGNMNEAMANTPQGQIKQMSDTWDGIMQTVGTKLYPAVMNFFSALNSHMPQAERFMMGLAGAIGVVINILSGIIDAAGDVVGFFQDNWSLIEPIIWGIAAALAVYYGWLALTKGAELASVGVSGVVAVAKGIMAAATTLLTGATWAQASAQWGLNGAMYACPIMWIVFLIIALVALFYGAVAAVNKFAGTSVSATGIIGGAFMWVVSVIGNLFIGLWNLVVDVFALIYNLIASVANFVGDVFNDPVGAVCRLFFDLADTVLGILQALASAIDTIFGSNLAASVQGWRDSLGGWVDDTFGQGEEIMKKMDPESMKLDRFDNTDAFDMGYKFGEGIDNKVKGLFGGDDKGGKEQGGGKSAASGAWDGINNNTGNTAANTAAMADSMDVLDEDLKYMRDAAEQEIINRFTLAELKVDVSNNNTLKTTTDFDDVNQKLGEATGAILAAAAEGVYS